jgi:aminopeptidase
MLKNFDSLLEKYADLIVHIGLNLRSGQRLWINAPLQTAPLVRLVTMKAYQAGARLVTVWWTDEQLKLYRFQYAPRDSFEEHPAWRDKALEAHIREGGALLSVYAENPELLKEQDKALIGIAMKTAAKSSQPVSELIMNDMTNWNVISMPIPGWAAKVFPALAPEQQIDRLWEAIFKVCRLDQPDPVAAWKTHFAQLKARCDILNARQYRQLHFKAPGTDLKVGLPQDHIWMGGSAFTTGGDEFAPNMPTEEVFTLPHRLKADGVVRAALPFVYGGNRIDGMSLTFKDGKVTGFTAESGADVLGSLLETDEGTRYLGEVALVPCSSPVASTGLLFYNLLYDENAGIHLALGGAYRPCLKDGGAFTTEEFIARGGNDSLSHEDFVIGSPQMDVDGLLPDGSTEPVFRKGEWAFKV